MCGVYMCGIYGVCVMYGYIHVVVYLICTLCVYGMYAIYVVYGMCNIYVCNGGVFCTYN